jgi:transcription initiation factor TFIIIB Brf1 subunit/transcription initiation factor TFIIB
MALATRIATTAERLGLPKHVEEQAMLLGRRLLEGMRTTGRRLTVLDMSAVALWGACKVMGIPISMDEFTEALGLHNGTSLFKLLSKAQRIASMPKKTFEAKDYVGRIAGKLSGMADPRYVSALESYARSICDSAGEALRGRDPVCAAAASLCVADETLGGWIGRERITEASGAGYSLSLAHKLRAAVPPPHISMRKLALEFIEKRVVEVKTDEVVRHVAS